MIVPPNPYGIIKIQIPSYSRELIYNGTYQSPEWENLNEKYVNVSGDTIALNAGTYTTRFSIYDKERCSWSDDTTEYKDVAWFIKKFMISSSSAPKQSGSLSYTGSSQTPSWSNYNTNLMTISGTTSAVNAGEYEAIFTLKDPSNYEFDLGDSSYHVTWKISKSIVPIPNQSGSLTYTGKTLTPTWDNYNSTIMNISGDTSAVNAGKYEATFTLKDPDNYMFSNGSDTYSASWSVNKSIISDYPVQSGDLVYNGNTLTPSWSNYDSSIMNISGITSAVNAGTYKVTFTMKDPGNYSFPNGSSSYSTSWMIIGIAAYPTQANTLTYTGSPLAATWKGYYPSYMAISGITSAVNAGIYQVKFTLSSGYIFQDGSTTYITYWSIQKSSPYLRLSYYIVGLDEISPVQSLTASRFGDGAITTDSSNPLVAGAVVNGNIIKIISGGARQGTAIITVYVAETSNYLSQSATVSVSANFSTSMVWEKGSRFGYIGASYALVSFNGEVFVSPSTTSYDLGSTNCSYSNSGKDWYDSDIVETGVGFYSISSGMLQSQYGDKPFIGVGYRYHKEGETFPSPYETKPCAMVANNTGKNWNVIDLPTTLPYDSVLLDIAIGNGLAVAVCSNHPYIAYTSNATNWSVVTAPNTFQSIAFGNGKFVATTKDNIGSFSTDGKNWDSITIPVSGASISFSNGLFFVFGQNVCYYSYDGIEWEQSSTSIPSLSVGQFGKVTYGNGIHMAGSYDKKVIYSTDHGKTWYETSNSPVDSRYVTYGNGIFVILNGQSVYYTTGEAV